jgi:methionine-rich copper-binding protein CopC
MQIRFSSCAALITLVSLPPLAHAHVHLEKSTPANGSVVAAAPASFTLVFSEAARLTALSIQKGGDPAAQKIAPLPRAASDHFTIAAPRLAPAVYTLRFRALDPQDNHVSIGKISFSYAPAAKVSPGRPTDMRNIGTRPTPDTIR